MGALVKPPKLPPPPEPTRLPVEDDKLAREASARRRSELLAARGRQSTDLTSGYRSQRLGE